VRGKEREKEKEGRDREGSLPLSSALSTTVLSPLHAPQSHYSPSTRDCERARHVDAFKAPVARELGFLGGNGRRKRYWET